MYDKFIIILLTSTVTLFGSEYKMPHRCDLSQSITTAPNSVQKKYASGIHPRCIFLTSVYEKDEDAVLWFFNNDKGYREDKKPLMLHKDDPQYAYFTNSLYYFSLCSQETNSSMCITPYDIATYKQDNKMLDLLHGYLGKDPKENSRKKEENTPPYDLFMTACSKPENYDIETAKQIIDLPFNTTSNRPDRKKAQWCTMLFLIALINNDRELKKFALKSKYFWWVDNAIVHFIGHGHGKSPFITNEEIIFLFNHPWIIEYKKECIETIKKQIWAYDNNKKCLYMQQTAQGKRHYQRVIELGKSAPSPKKNTVKHDHDDDESSSDDDAPSFTLKEYVRATCIVACLFTIILVTKIYFPSINPEVPTLGFLLLLMVKYNGFKKP
jgi:hypothetical protein